MSYGLTTWSQAHQSSVKTIECLYNRAWKVLDKKRIRYHHCQILSKYKILCFENFTSLHFVKLVFKCLNNAAPISLCKIITRQQSRTRSATRSALKDNCSIPFCRTSFAQTAFSIKEAKLLNSLPDHLKCIPTLATLTKQKLIVANSGTIFALIFSFYIVFLCSTSYFIYILFLLMLFVLLV